MNNNSPAPSETPLDRLTWQLDFARARQRDQIVVTRGDLEYLMAQLHSRGDHMYKGETPQA